VKYAWRVARTHLLLLCIIPEKVENSKQNLVTIPKDRSNSSLLKHPLMGGEARTRGCGLPRYTGILSIGGRKRKACVRLSPNREHWRGDAESCHSPVV
jgi:hypothetical protein